MVLGSWKRLGCLSMVAGQPVTVRVVSIRAESRTADVEFLRLATAAASPAAPRADPPAAW